MQQGLILDIRCDANGNKVLYFPIMFISDIHLGTKHSRALKTSHALEHTAAGQTYFVGDIFDIAGQKKWNLTGWHREVVAHAFRRADAPGKVTYIPGNHDIDIRNRRILRGHTTHSYRNMCGKTVYNVAIKESDKCVTPDGKVLEVIHGDQFDPALAKLSSIGNAALELVSNVDTYFQRIPGCSHISLAAKGKRAVKKSVDKVWHIRKNIADRVDNDPLIDGIVSGHEHMSRLDRTEKGKLVLNDGCCTEHVEFAVIDERGNAAVIEWHYSYIKITEEIEKKGSKVTQERYVTFESLGLQFERTPKQFDDEAAEKADRVLRPIYRLWPPKERRKAAKKAQFASAQDKAFLRIVSLPLPNHHRTLKLKRAEKHTHRKSNQTNTLAA